MTTQRNPHDQGDKVSAARRAKSKALAERADQRGALARARDDKSGKFLAKMQPEDWADVLNRISDGDLEANICRHYGIDRSSIVEKRKRDPEFSALYDEALFNGFINIAHDTRAIARGIEGYTTGDRQRDELVIKTDMELAKKFAARVLGDRIQIDQRQISIVMPKGIDYDDFG